MNSVDVVKNLYERFQKQDMEGVLACFAENCEVELVGPSSIPFTGKFHGRAGMREMLEKFVGAIDMLDFRPDEFHGAQDFVTVLGHQHCRSKTTGREWKTPVVDTWVVSDGKIQKFRCMFDTAAVASAYAGTQGLNQERPSPAPRPS